MKKLSILAFVLTFLVVSCEEKEVETTATNLVEIAKNHYEKKTKNLRAGVDSLQGFYPNWNLSEIINLPNQDKIVFAPLQRNMKVVYSSDIGFMRGLIVEFDKKSNVKETEMIEVAGNLNFIKSNKHGIISNRNADRIKNFTGGLILTKLGDSSKKGIGFKDGNKSGSVSIQNKTKNLRMVSICIDWYLVTTNQDGTQTWTYLYNTCNDFNSFDPGISGSGGEDDAAKCKSPCKPVPVGGLAYEFHSTALGNKEHAGMEDHTHHFRMNQSPPSAGCKCFWDRNYIDPTNGFSPKPGSVKVEPASGGGN